MIKEQLTSYNIKQINSLPLSSYPTEAIHSLRNSVESVCMV